MLAGLYSTVFACGLSAQQSAVYRDALAPFKRGMEFYNQALYGKAQDEFKQLLDRAPIGTDKDWNVMRLKSELYYGMAALRLQNPDAEKNLLAFIYRNEPAPIASLARLEVGRYYYNNKSYDQAIAYLSSVPTADLSNAEIIELKFQLGYAHFAKKQFNKARPQFQQIRGAKSDYYEQANYYYGLSSFYENDYNEALESFKLVANDKKHQYNAVVPVYICQIYFAQKKYDEVISYGKTVVNSSDVRDKETISQLIGQSLFEKGDYRGALPYLEAYVSKSSKVSQEVLYQLAYTQYRTGNYGAAVQNFEQLNTLETELGQNALYNMADCYLKTNNKTAARQAFQRAAAMNFDKTIKEDALINYAKLSYELGFDNDAITALQQIPEKSTYHGEAQNLMSDIFLNTRDYESALKTIRAINNKNAKLKETHQKVAYFRGIQLYKEKQADQAMKLFDESLQAGNHDETKALVHFWKAEIYYQQEQTDKSISEYDQYLDLAPKAKNLPANSSAGVANYGLGYNYIRKNDFKRAGDNFSSAVDKIKKLVNTVNDKYVTDYVYPDALLRAGDCFLFQNSYGKAATFYRTIIDNNYPNTDYALYQQSLIYHLTNQPYDQLALLDKLIKNYPTSLYADDALYAAGNAYFALKRYDLAKAAYERIGKEYPTSEFVNRALLKQGIIAYGENKNEEALRYYEAVFRNAPQSEEAKDAMGFMEEIYVEMGNPEGYFNFLNTVQGYSIDEAARDSVMYRSAERKFKASDWESAASGFSKYLERYPAGNNSLQARFYRAEALYELKRYADALRDYAVLSDKNNLAYAETANLRAAAITYHIEATRDFAAAYKYYTRLEQYATTEENRYDAHLYGMRSAYYSNNMAQVPTAADKMLKDPRATAADKAEAYYFLGKVQLASKSYAKAKEYFAKNIELSGDDVFAAEARYQIAYMTYMERDLTKAQEMCFKTNKEIPNHPYWLVKSFILLSDIYAEQNNLFQAKATLESIVNNYRGDDALLNEARTKLENVKKAEANSSKLETPTNNTNTNPTKPTNNTTKPSGNTTKPSGKGGKK